MTTKIIMKDKEIVSPGDLLATGNDLIAGDGTYKKGDNVYASVVGFFNSGNKVLKVMRIKGWYDPKQGDYIIGVVTDMNFSNWFLEIGGPYDAALPIREASREYIDLDKHDMTHYFDYEDIVFAKILNITGSKVITLTAKEPELKKLEGGILTKLNPAKVPRLIGSKGNMVNMIKEKTKTQIIIGQNGYIWVKGNADDVKKVKDAIKLIDEESHISGLTDKVEKMLSKGGRK